MGFERVQLRKLLMFAALPQKDRVSRYKDDIKQRKTAAAAAAQGNTLGGGGGFYGLFWKDAKDSVLENLDLVEATEKRIAEDYRKKNIFPKLLAGFQSWWRDKRRWTNEPFTEGRRLTGRYSASDGPRAVNIENILSVSDGEGVVRHLYPYWYNEPPLTAPLAAMGLQALAHAFPEVDPTSFRILDIIRGETYSLDKVEVNEGDLDQLNELHERFCEEYDQCETDLDE